MVIANGDNIYMINDIMAGKKVGTLFIAKKNRLSKINEVAPERPQYKHLQKKIRKDSENEFWEG